MFSFENPKNSLDPNSFESSIFFRFHFSFFLPASIQSRADSMDEEEEEEQEDGRRMRRKLSNVGVNFQDGGF